MMCLTSFRNDLAKYESAVNMAFKVPLKQHEFDAAVSFHYNTGAISRASWVKSFNAGKREQAIQADYELEEASRDQRPPER